MYKYLILLLTFVLTSVMATDEVIYRQSFDGDKRVKITYNSETKFLELNLTPRSHQERSIILTFSLNDFVEVAEANATISERLSGQLENNHIKEILDKISSLGSVVTRDCQGLMFKWENPLAESSLGDVIDYIGTKKAFATSSINLMELNEGGKTIFVRAFTNQFGDIVDYAFFVMGHDQSNFSVIRESDYYVLVDKRTGKKLVKVMITPKENGESIITLIQKKDDPIYNASRKRFTLSKDGQKWKVSSHAKGERVFLVDNNDYLRDKVNADVRPTVKVDEENLDYFDPKLIRELFPELLENESLMVSRTDYFKCINEIKSYYTKEEQQKLDLSDMCFRELALKNIYVSLHRLLKKTYSDKSLVQDIHKESDYFRNCLIQKQVIKDLRGSFVVNYELLKGKAYIDEIKSCLDETYERLNLLSSVKEIEDSIEKYKGISLLAIDGKRESVLREKLLKNVYNACKKVKGAKEARCKEILKLYAPVEAFRLTLSKEHLKTFDGCFADTREEILKSANKKSVSKKARQDFNDFTLSCMTIVVPKIIEEGAKEEIDELAAKVSMFHDNKISYSKLKMNWVLSRYKNGVTALLNDAESIDDFLKSYGAGKEKAKMKAFKSELPGLFEEYLYKHYLKDMPINQEVKNEIKKEFSKKGFINDLMKDEKATIKFLNEEILPFAKESGLNLYLTSYLKDKIYKNFSLADINRFKDYEKVKNGEVPEGVSKFNKSVKAHYYYEIMSKTMNNHSISVGDNIAQYLEKEQKKLVTKKGEVKGDIRVIAKRIIKDIEVANSKLTLERDLKDKYDFKFAEEVHHYVHKEYEKAMNEYNPNNNEVTLAEFQAPIEKKKKAHLEFFVEKKALTKSVGRSFSLNSDKANEILAPITYLEDCIDKIPTDLSDEEYQERIKKCRFIAKINVKMNYLNALVIDRQDQIGNPDTNNADALNRICFLNIITGILEKNKGQKEVDELTRSKMFDLAENSLAEFDAIFGKYKSRKTNISLMANMQGDLFSKDKKYSDAPSRVTKLIADNISENISLEWIDKHLNQCDETTSDEVLTGYHAFLLKKFPALDSNVKNHWGESFKRVIGDSLPSILNERTMKILEKLPLEDKTKMGFGKTVVTQKMSRQIIANFFDIIGSYVSKGYIYDPDGLSESIQTLADKLISRFDYYEKHDEVPTLEDLKHRFEIDEITDQVGKAILAERFKRILFDFLKRRQAKELDEFMKESGVGKGRKKKLSDNQKRLRNNIIRKYQTMRQVVNEAYKKKQFDRIFDTTQEGSKGKKLFDRMKKDVLYPMILGKKIPKEDMEFVDKVTIGVAFDSSSSTNMSNNFIAERFVRAIAQNKLDDQSDNMNSVWKFLFYNKDDFQVHKHIGKKSYSDAVKIFSEAIEREIQGDTKLLYAEKATSSEHTSFFGLVEDDMMDFLKRARNEIDPSNKKEVEKQRKLKERNDRILYEAEQLGF